MAVARGHLTVTLPVVFVIALAGFIGWLLADTGSMLIGIISCMAVLVIPLTAMA
jgi:hypothetical protein